MNTEKRYRVGFLLHPNYWVGGKNYLKNLFAAIKSVPGNIIDPVVITGIDTDLNIDFETVEVVRTSIFDRKSAVWFLREGIARLSSYDPILRRLLRQQRISVLSHCFNLDTTFSIPTLGWIPDFQHVHLPEFFSIKERRRRSGEFMSLCRNSDRIIVSSVCADTDLKSFAPEFAHKSEVMRFVSGQTLSQCSITLDELQHLYRFEGPYFLLPNQFWAHKNHLVVLKALKILKQQNMNVLVLSTGSTDDYRQPHFFSALMQFGQENNVLDSFRVLGQVPYEHLVGLMQHAVAFINPSRFEGWSSTVEEAKSMGKQIVLSDIPVHREQAPQRSFFFPPEEPDILAEKMIAAAKQFDLQNDVKIQAIANTEFTDRQRAFGERYEQIVFRALRVVPHVDRGIHLE